MIDEFDAVFLSWKTIVEGRVRIEETTRNGEVTRNVYFKPYDMVMGMFPSKWHLVVHNFDKRLENYSEVRHGRIDGVTDNVRRVYWFDFYTLEPFYAKMAIEKMIESENNLAQADFFSNMHAEQQELVVESSIQSSVRKQVMEDVEFVNRMTFKPTGTAKPLEAKKK